MPVDPSLIRWGSLLGPPVQGSVDLRLLLRSRGDDLADDLSRCMSDQELTDAQVACGRVRAAIRSAEAAGLDWRRRYPHAVPQWMVVEAQRSLLCIFSRIEIPSDAEQLHAIQGLFSRSEWEGVEIFLDPDAPQEFRKRISSKLLGGRLHPLVEVLPGETGRMATRPGSFPVMSWARGSSRRCLISSFINGRIVSIDFNGMDARSLLSLSESLRDEFLPLGSLDIYSAIALRCLDQDPSTINPVTRRVIKDSFLRLAYGSTDEALADELRINQSAAAGLRRAFEPLLSRLPVKGTRLALLGQAASSEAFRRACVAVADVFEGCRGFPLWPVHDELLFDLPFDEMKLVPLLKERMSSAASSAREGFPYAVRAKVGPSYDELGEF